MPQTTFTISNEANRLLTAGLLHASGYAPVRSRITPAAAALPAVFTRVVNALGH